MFIVFVCLIIMPTLTSALSYHKYIIIGLFPLVFSVNFEANLETLLNYCKNQST